jgi:hypothetical protein
MKSAVVNIYRVWNGAMAIGAANVATIIIAKEIVFMAFNVRAVDISNQCQQSRYFMIINFLF